MEKPNTDISSETPIELSSIHGYKKALLLKEAHIRLAGSKWDTHIFKRFYEIPNVLSNILAVVLMVAFGELILAADIPYILKFGTGLIGLFVSAWAKMDMYQMMAKARIHEWGNGKFETWAEFDSWLKKTSPMEWEALVDCPYPWVVNMTDGGGDIIEDPAYL